MLKFVESTQLCYRKGEAFEAPGYSVVHYNYGSHGGAAYPHKHWRAYTQPDGMSIDGKVEYKTKTEAFKACRLHLAAHS